MKLAIHGRNENKIRPVIDGTPYVNDNILGIYCWERTIDEDDNSLDVMELMITAIPKQAPAK